MGFFSDLKEDLSQAVNDLMPPEAQEQKEKNEDKVVEQLAERAKESDTAILTKTPTDIVSVPEADNRVSIPTSAETAVVIKGMMIEGDVRVDGSMQLLGTVKGNIDVKGSLYITGILDGDLQTAQLMAEHARIQGSVCCAKDAVVQEGTVIIGNITASGAVIAGAVKGDVDVKGLVVLRSTAAIRGNVRCKSVQIEGGAVIEGTCSQCYAEVDLDKLFAEAAEEIVEETAQP